MILEKFEINPVLMYDTLRKPSSSFQLEQDELEIGVSPSGINFFFIEVKPSFQYPNLSEKMRFRLLR